ncbi:MAG: type II toxin-antitoxin system VapC family toxin [Desulfuromusa sp.]|nr:type II toxin-antitoxin system VapC family toxin [Desulfuromusa sp.]
MLLLDTHVLVWLVEGNQRLGSNALEKINQALSDAQLYVASISFWEIAMLIEKGHLEFCIEPGTWRHNLLQDGLQEISLTGSAAIQAGQFKYFHGDPADRMIVATALEKGATLVTADKKILGWNKLKQKIDASR